MSQRRALGADWRLVRMDGTDLGEVSLPHRWEDDPRIGPDFSGTLAYVATVTTPSHARTGPARPGQRASGG